MSKLEKDAAIVVLAQQARRANWTLDEFKDMYGETDEEKTYIEDVLYHLDMLEYYHSYYIGSKFTAVYEWK